MIHKSYEHAEFTEEEIKRLAEIYAWIINRANYLRSKQEETESKPAISDQERLMRDLGLLGE